MSLELGTRVFFVYEDSSDIYESDAVIVGLKEIEGEEQYVIQVRNRNWINKAFFFKSKKNLKFYHPKHLVFLTEKEAKDFLEKRRILYGK